ncbi:MAG: hypothetical protein K2H92_01020, partial [Bacteroidaceae bacterium]|nr:hypothetical protein [Bacteroidaceae bacterium]
MRRTIPILLSVFCIAIQGIRAQNTIDFTVAKDTVLCLERMVERIDTIVLSRSDLSIQSISFANILMNDSLVMLGAMDGAVYSIKDGSLVRKFSEVPFNIAQMTGEAAEHPGSALLDSHGKYCYAWGNAIFGNRRINYIKKMNFGTGEVADSVDVDGADFALSRDDSLRVATNRDYMMCFPEYSFKLPNGGRVFRIAYFDNTKLWIKFMHEQRRKNYICNSDGTQMAFVKQITLHGRS